MSGRRIVRGGRVVDPAQGIDQELDVEIEDGRIVRLAEGIEPAAGDEVTDARGLVVTPGLIDLHVHLREPGQEYKETIKTGLMAAAAGGFTAVVAMANTDPPNDNRAVTELVVREAARHPYARVHPVGALSRGLKGEELAEIGEMVEAGIVAVSDAIRAVKSADLLRRALYYTRHFAIPVIQHTEDYHLAGDGVMHEGVYSTRLGLPGIPGLAEDAMVARDLLLAEESDGRYHLMHVSTARSLDMVREAKRRGLRASCAVTPHHLLLTDSAVEESGFSTATKMKPPLRSADDAAALVEGLADGTVDAISSNHAPHHPDEKDVQFSLAPFGIVGLETTLSLCLDRLVRPGRIGLGRLVELLSRRPAEILGLDAGSLEPGRPADLTLIDLEREVTVEASRFYSLGRSTPFDGWTLRGAAAGTIVGGRPVELPPRPVRPRAA